MDVALDAYRASSKHQINAGRKMKKRRARQNYHFANAKPNRLTHAGKEDGSLLNAQT